MTAAVAHLAAARCSRRTSSPAKVPFTPPIKATLKELKVAARWRDDAPTDVPAARFEEVAGVTVLHLAFCALNSGVELDLGNGYVMSCTVKEAPCAG